MGSTVRTHIRTYIVNKPERSSGESTVHVCSLNVRMYERMYACMGSWHYPHDGTHEENLRHFQHGQARVNTHTGTNVRKRSPVKFSIVITPQAHP